MQLALQAWESLHLRENFVLIGIIWVEGLTLNLNPNDIDNELAY